MPAVVRGAPHRANRQLWRLAHNAPYFWLTPAHSARYTAMVRSQDALASILGATSSKSGPMWHFSAAEADGHDLVVDIANSKCAVYAHANKVLRGMRACTKLQELCDLDLKAPAGGGAAGTAGEAGHPRLLRVQLPADMAEAGADTATEAVRALFDFMYGGELDAALTPGNVTSIMMLADGT